MAEAMNLPKFEMNIFAKWVASATIEYFANPEVQVRFEKWKKERSVESGREANVLQDNH